MGPMRAFLTNEQKLRLREYWGAQPQLTHFEVADWVRAKFQISVSRSTLYRISQASDDAFAGRLHKKKPRRVKFPAFETELLAFYHTTRQSDDSAQVTTRPLRASDVLARKAVELRAKHGIAHDKLKLSNGWLHSFKARHSLKTAPTASGLVEATAGEGSVRDGEAKQKTNEVTNVSLTAATEPVPMQATTTESPAIATRRPSKATVAESATSVESSSANDVAVVMTTAALADDTTRDPASEPSVTEPVVQQIASPPPPPTSSKPAAQPLIRILAKALSAVRSGTTLNWEHVQQQQPPVAESHFAVVNDGIQILQDGVYQINVDLQHTTKADTAFQEVFSVWNGTTRLNQCTSILHCDAAGMALSVSEAQCFLAASACIRVDYKAPGYALPQSRIVIRLV